MSDVADFPAVERKARTLFGEYASHWLFKPNRSLAQLSPYEHIDLAAAVKLVGLAPGAGLEPL
jgi:hypothetical protein